jgi:uncharacterized membrane protein YdjX (TVP38/TMEM64 family)
MIAWVEGLRLNPWRAFYFSAIFVLGVTVLPIMIFPIIGGVLFSYWVALPLNVLCMTGGGWLAFGIARLLGRDAVAPYLSSHFHKLDELATTRGFYAVFLIRWLGVPPFAVTNVALGLSAVRKRDFLAGTMLGMLPWMALVTRAASSLWSALRQEGEKGLMVQVWRSFWPLMALAVVTGTIVLVMFWKRRRKAATVGT